jgi:hypothetical protein
MNSRKSRRLQLEKHLAELKDVDEQLKEVIEEMSELEALEEELKCIYMLNQNKEE